MTPGEWKDLALRLQKGDAGSEEEFARLFYPHLMAYAASRLSDKEAAREIVQETILAVILALRQDRLRVPEKLPAFVTGTGRNLINSFVRNRALRPELHALNFEKTIFPDPDPDGNGLFLEREERKDLVLGVLQDLKAIDRKIIHLTLSEGMTPQEIALELGLKPETIRLHKSRALKRLRRKMRALIRKGRLNH